MCGSLCQRLCTIATAPFACEPCGFISGTEAKLTKHLSTNRHTEKVKTRKGEVVKRGPSDLVSKYFTSFDQAESSEFWGKRSRKQDAQGDATITPAQQQLIDQLTQKIVTGEIDTLEAAILASGVGSVTGEEKSTGKEEKAKSRTSGSSRSSSPSSSSSSSNSSNSSTRHSSTGK